MIGGRHYPNAPITEAVIDLRVKQRAELKLEEVEAVRSEHKEDYPKSEEVYEARGIMQVGVGAASASA